MGKRLFQEVYASPERTDALALPGLVVVTEADKDEDVTHVYHVVHKSYFSGEKPKCPFCQSENVAEKKIRARKFKDILPSGKGKENVIDLIFHQRFFRCSDCGKVFPENIDFAEEGCRYTNRLSDILAEGTLTRTYEKVCKEYGVPASKTSVGIIMRRRLKTKFDSLPPLDTPEALAVFVTRYYTNAYPVILGISKDNVRLLDILDESSESAYRVFFESLEKEKVRRIFIDPDEQLHSAVAASFPFAQIMVSEECIRRFVRDAFSDVIKKEGSRCFIHQRYHTLCKSEGYLTPYEQKQVGNTLKRRHRLKAAYNAYQELLVSMDSKWDVESIRGWLKDLPSYVAEVSDEDEEIAPLQEFEIIEDVLYLYEDQVKAYLNSTEKPPAMLISSVMGIVDSLDAMPFCIYDVLRARMLLNVDQDYIHRNGKQYRQGVPIERITRKMNEITRQIKTMKENIENGYEPEN